MARKSRKKPMSMRLLSVAVSIPVIAWTLPGVWESLQPRPSAVAQTERPANLAKASREAAERCAGPDMPAPLKRFLADTLAETIRATARGSSPESQAKLDRAMDRRFAQVFETLSPEDQVKAAAAFDAMTTGSTGKNGSACMLKAALKKMGRG